MAPQFDTIDFSKFNEQDVREEVVAPLLRKLGYRTGTPNNVIRELPLTLRYDKAYLGRKNPKRDPVLRGKADYVCEVEGPIRWVIECKAPNIPIEIDAIEQGYTYAVHPEVRAVLFCLCNGHELQVYQANLGDEAPPLLTLSYGELETRWFELEQWLSPKAIQRRFPSYIADVGKPLGPGLRSIVRIAGGKIEYAENSLNAKHLEEFVLAVTGGSIERNEEGKMVAVLKTLSPYKSLQRLNEQIGNSDIEAVSADSVISVDPANPTVFIDRRTIVCPAGEKILDIASWREIVLPQNITFHSETTASGTLRGNVFMGSFHLHITMLGLEFAATGTFELYAT